MIKGIVTYFLKVVKENGIQYEGKFNDDEDTVLRWLHRRRGVWRVSLAPTSIYK